MGDFFDEEYQKYNQKMSSDNNNGNLPPQPKSYTSNAMSVVRKVLLIFLIIGIFVMGIFLGSVLSKGNDWGLLQDVVTEYRNNSIYYDAETWDDTFKQMIVNAGTYMLQTTDSYGFVLSPQEFYDIMYPTDGSTTPTYGFGYTSSQLGLYVTTVTYGSGAYVGGLSAGDVILFVRKAGGTSLDLRTATSEEISTIMSGDWDSQVTLTVLRGFDEINSNSSEEVTLTINDITLKKIKYENNFVDYYFGADKTDITADSTKEKLNLNLLDGKDVGYIRVNSFEAVYDEDQLEIDSASLQFANAMTVFKEVYAGKGKLILDLRGNPGGSISEAVDIASYLIIDLEKTDNHSYLVTNLKGQNDEFLSDYYTSGNLFAEYFDIQLASQNPRIAVMTDGNSASASELLLGCILDYNTGIQIGSTSYGKGIAQTVKPLNYSGEAKIYSGEQVTRIQFPYGIYYTFARYYSPKTNTNIHGKGYTPSINNQVNTKDNRAMMSRALDYFAGV